MTELHTTRIDITREHPEYVEKRDIWQKYKDLYTGGEEFKASASRYLIPRHKEAQQVYYERLGRVFYENYAGSIIDWYSATLFRREPVLTFQGNERGKQFFSAFVEDCDHKGTNVTDFFRQRMVEALVGGRSHILIDFPRPYEHADTRADEDALGLSRAYLIGYSPEHMINWSFDDHGNYEWIVLRTTSLQKKDISEQHWAKRTRWAHYDKRKFHIYEREEGDGAKGHVDLIAEGTHGFAKLDRVPVVDLRAGEGLWLMNRAGLLQLEHFNKSNALAWALTMGLFASPVVYSDKQFNQIMGESYYIQLAPGDRFGWTEPAGNVFQIASENLRRLQQEIYRVCYLSQAGGELAGNSAQSGASKERDFSITQEVLRSYGDTVKDVLKRVLRWIAEARDDAVLIDVSGLDEFDIGDFGSELAEAERLLALGISSPTLRKEVFKKLSLKYLCDVRQDIKDQIVREINSE